MIHYKKAALLLGLLGTFQVDAAASSKAIKIGVGVVGAVLLGGKAGIDWIQVSHVLNRPDEKRALQLLASKDCTLSFRVGSFHDPKAGGEDTIYRDMSAQRAYALVRNEAYVNQDLEEVSALRICSAEECVDVQFPGEVYRFREFLALSNHADAPMSLRRAIATYRLKKEAE